ncbi:hypothetical protein [Streptomyces sp. NPDC096012]|uniref:hypothetical protein n=1 Tax=Streptomyces sp. NPDC096012 TaxID=3155684 RepID=UPI00336A2596
MGKTSLLLAVRQQGLCPLCRQVLIVGAEYEPDSPREWINWFAASKKMLHKHHFAYRRDGGTDERNNLATVRVIRAATWSGSAGGCDTACPRRDPAAGTAGASRLTRAFDEFLPVDPLLLSSLGKALKWTRERICDSGVEPQRALKYMKRINRAVTRGRPVQRLFVRLGDSLDLV